MARAQYSPQKAGSNRALNGVAIMWGVYYVLFTTLARYEDYQWFTLWVCGALTVVISVYVFRAHLYFSREVLFFGGFFFWCLLQIGDVVSMESYMRYLKLVAEGVIIVACVSKVISMGGHVGWLYAGLLVGALLSGVQPLFEGQKLSIAPEDMDRMFGLTQPCAVGFTQVLGIVGALGLWCESVLHRWRPLLITAIGLCITFLVATGSRGPYALMLVVAVVWFWLCFRQQFRRTVVRFVVIGLAVLGLWFGNNWVGQNTYLGVRSQTYMERFERGETEKRLDLAEEAFDIFRKNPVMGVGLNQFRYISVFGTEAHNDIGELLSTTGLVGFILMMGVYLGPWRRISLAARRVERGDLFFRFNHSRVILMLILISMSFRTHISQFDSAFLLGITIGMGQLAHRFRVDSEYENSMPPHPSDCRSLHRLSSIIKRRHTL